MDERDDSDLLPEENISDEISERVRSVISAAESAAIAIRHEAEQSAQGKRRAAEQERERYLEKARGEAEALLDERIKRISELSDSIIEGAESLLLRIDAAHEVRTQLENVLRALAGAAEELAAESGQGRAAAAPPSISVVDDPPEPLDRSVVTELRAAREPEVTEAEEVVDDEGPAEPADLKPVEVEPDDEPEHKRSSPVERLREAAGHLRGNGSDESTAEEASPIEGDEMLAARLVALQMAVAGSARVEVEKHLQKTFSMEDPAAILDDVFGNESKL